MTRGTVVAAGTLALGLVAACSGASDPTVRVLAAASLTDVFEQLAVDFEAAHPGIGVELQFGGSSQLASLIVEGAPGDVFASADLVTMARVVESGETGASPRVFATNTLTLVVPPDNPGAVTGLPDLADPDLLVAQCATEVPCGSATATLFAGAGLAVDADTLEPNVRAVLSKVELGEVDVGVVYRTDALAAGDAVVEIPLAPQTVANEYAIVSLADASSEADRFVGYVLSDDGRATLADHGFGRP